MEQLCRRIIPVIKRAIPFRPIFSILITSEFPIKVLSGYKVDNDVGQAPGSLGFGVTKDVLSDPIILESVIDEG